MGLTAQPFESLNPDRLLVSIYGTKETLFSSKLSKRENFHSAIFNPNGTGRARVLQVEPSFRTAVTTDNCLAMLELLIVAEKNFTKLCNLPAITHYAYYHLNNMTRMGVELQKS